MENALEDGFACASPASLRCRGARPAGGWCWAGIGDALVPSCAIAKGAAGAGWSTSPEQTVGETLCHRDDHVVVTVSWVLSPVVP